MEAKLKEEMIAVARRIYEHDFVAASDGNLSTRLGDEEVLITASGTYLGELRPEQIVRVSLDGEQLEVGTRPSSEMPLHLEVYCRRPDVRAVVHAHPPVATAFSYAGVSMEDPVIPEVVLTFGAIPTTPYGTPGSEEGAHVVAGLIEKHDALVLQRHGAVTVGTSPIDAYYKLEKLEHAAHMLFVARQLGHVIQLSPDELRRLDAVRIRLGLPQRGN